MWLLWNWKKYTCDGLHLWYEKPVKRGLALLCYGPSLSAVKWLKVMAQAGVLVRFGMGKVALVELEKLQL